MAIRETRMPGCTDFRDSGDYANGIYEQINSGELATDFVSNCHTPYKDVTAIREIFEASITLFLTVKDDPNASEY